MPQSRINLPAATPVDLVAALSLNVGQDGMFQNRGEGPVLAAALTADNPSATDVAEVGYSIAVNDDWQFTVTADEKIWVVSPSIDGRLSAGNV